MLSQDDFVKLKQHIHNTIDKSDNTKIEEIPASEEEDPASYD